MVSKLISIEEERRLETLKSYYLTESEKDSTFDDFSQLASVISGLPFAGVCLIDEERTWFKSTVGFDLNVAPRERTICSFVVESKSLVVVKNAKTGSDYNCRLLWENYGVDFYAGFPILTPEGCAIGVMFVAGNDSNSISEEKIHLLRSLVRQVQTTLELRRTNFKLKEAEAIVVENARMASVGLLSAGISHEINNPLSMITGNVNILKLQAEEGWIDAEEVLSYCKKIESNTTRISKIIKSMRTFAGKGDNDPVRDQTPSSIVKNVLEYLDSEIKKNEINIEVETEEACSITVSETQISQVLSNLVYNSIGAIKDLESRWIKISAKSIGDDVEITVTDSGTGISNENQSKLFVPFFTTKPIGSGTGLGLSLCKGLVEKNGGKIHYDNKSINTRFVMKFPKTIRLNSV